MNPRGFGSDNHAGVLPEVLEAIAAANTGHAGSYGHDAWTSRLEERFQELFGDDAGRIPATFQILMLSGWTPDPSQPQPIRRGSGRVNLAEALGVPAEVLDGKAKR